MREHWANPSSLYAPGARSEEALNAARAAVARTLGCKSRELYFTSCGSESNNMALLGAALTRRFGKGIVVSGFEHPSVQKPLERLAAMGYDVTVVDPGPDGTLDIDRMLDHVDKNTILVACMMVNNEVGTRNDVERLAAEVKRRNSRTIVHVDAVQAWMRVPIKLANIDTLAVSGHKIHAPKGIGALYLSDSLYQAFQAPYLGGEQEREKRPGTENLPYALGHALAEKYMPNGTCGVLCFGPKGGRDGAMRFTNGLKMVAIVTHVADARSCVLHPASHTHRQLNDQQLIEAGVLPDLIRLSVGIEDVNDIIADLDQALANV